jgi:hypothetical protein
MTVLHQPNAWMTSDLMLKWLQLNNLNEKHLLLDSFSGHKSAVVMEKLQTIKHTFIPPRCTAQCQPLDVGVNKPFKDRLRKYWNDYIQKDQLTTSGNYKAVPIALLLSWIDLAYKDISATTIKNSFKCCFPVT